MSSGRFLRDKSGSKNITRRYQAGRPAERTIREVNYQDHTGTSNRSQSPIPRDQPDFDHDGPQTRDHTLNENPPGLGQKSDFSPGLSPSVEDNFEKDSEEEPEMLLQPETRPISYEQLVVETKGIYAGLAIVEAKCIDVDERQLAAAQEKDPSKRTELKNDQWQSLIALHRQVHTLP